MRGNAEEGAKYLDYLRTERESTCSIPRALLDDESGKKGSSNEAGACPIKRDNTLP